MGLERRDRAVHGQREVNPVGVDPAGEEPRVRPNGLALRDQQDAVVLEAVDL